MSRKIYSGSFKERGHQAAHTWRKAHKEQWKLCQRYSKIKAKFGISQEQYESLWKAQKGLCAICKQPETSIDSRIQKTRMLAVDHCHITNRNRGLLCMNCNQGLGKFKDDIKLLESAIQYLVGALC